MHQQWSADRELELACKVGSIADFQRALYEGADVNADGGSPLFLAIMRGHREIVARLLEAGARPSLFLKPWRLSRLKTRDQVLKALMEATPATVVDDDLPDGSGKDCFADNPRIRIA